MSLDSSIWCIVCSGRDFESANGAFYCQSCGTESLEHGQDFIYEANEKNTSLASHSAFYEGSDSNDENHWKNEYPDEDLLESESTDSLSTDEENLDKLHFTSGTKQKNFDSETEEESQDEVQAGS